MGEVSKLNSSIVTSDLELEMENFFEMTMVVDFASKLPLSDIMRVVIQELDETPTRREVHDRIMQSFPDCDFKKTSDHKDHSPAGNYKLCWIDSEEKKAAASVLLCVGTAFEGATLASLVKMAEDLDLRDFDMKSATIGFSPDFSTIIVLGEPSDRGGYPMYGMTKTLVGILPNLKTGSCAARLNMGTIVIATSDAEGVVCDTGRCYPMYGMTKTLVGILPNLKKAYKTGSCAARLDMGTVVVATNNPDGVVCDDPCSGTDWHVEPGFPKQSKHPMELHKRA